MRKKNKTENYKSYEKILKNEYGKIKNKLSKRPLIKKT